MLHYLIVCTAISAGGGSMGCTTIPAPYPSIVECGKAGYELAKSKKKVSIFTHCVPAPSAPPAPDVTTAPHVGPIDIE